jgi:hypothetical protein
MTRAFYASANGAVIGKRLYGDRETGKNIKASTHGEFREAVEAVR